jgi:hypothetical protein
METKVSDVQLRIAEPVILSDIPKEDIKNVVPTPSIAKVAPNKSTSDLIIVYKNKKSTSNFIGSIILIIVGIIVMLVLIL